MSTSEARRGDSVEISASREVAGQMRALRIALGFGTVVLGLVTLFWPGVTLVVVAVLFGAQLVVAGAMRIATAIVSRDADGWLRAVLFVVGVLVLLAGLLCLRNPFASLLSLVLLISFGWMVDGVVELLSAASPDLSAERGFHVIGGIVSIIGALLLLFWPGLALLTFTVLGGWLLVIFGVMSAGSALRETRMATRTEPMRAGGSTAATA
jgi:uncharacterized membrane protein HdeD (DUF308 family)